MNRSADQEKNESILFIRTALKFLEPLLSLGEGEFNFAKQALEVNWEGAPLSGIRMGVSDMIELCLDLSDDQINELDSRLEAVNAPTVSIALDISDAPPTMLVF